MRLMTWNLLEGGNEVRSNEVKLTSRVESAKKLVDELSPDILVINEALWCENYNDQMINYAKMFGFEHSAGKLYDKNWGNVILSKFPIVDIKVFSIYNRGGIVTKIDCGDMGYIQVATYHPHPSRYAFNKQTDILCLHEMADHSLPIFICGDMNAINPHDGVCREKLAKAFAAFSANPEKDSARFVDGGEKLFEAADWLGLHDAIPVRNRTYTMPTKLISDNLDSAMRIDHILTNRVDMVKEGWIHMSQYADEASDHYPVLVELQVAE